MIKYFFSYSLFGIAYLSFTFSGWISWLLPVYVFGLLPLIELFTKPSVNTEELGSISQKRDYDFIIYLVFIYFDS